MIRASQTCESFSNSFNKASVIFALVHCDVWGPYKVKAHWGAT